MYEGCRECDGQLEYLGRLGNYDWFRCIHCGCEDHIELNWIDEEDEDMWEGTERFKVLAKEEE